MISLLLAVSLAHADEPVDLGVLKNSELRVVQKVLYPLAGRSEIDVALGVMPFDGFTVAPQVTGAYTQHLSEKVGVQVQVGGGYGLKTARYVLLESSTYGVAVEAYRYLASLEAAAEYTPIYAKMNLGNGTILHHDVFFVLGAGATLEQSVFPSGEITVAPTFPVGIGTRVYVSPNMAIRAEFRDNLMYEYRAQSQTGAFKQNAAVSVGVALLGKAKK
jgi:outer membrane beta-barrel protein